jgi:hypothetical protein
MENARTFFQRQGLENISELEKQRYLFSLFWDTQTNEITRAEALLCLRCLVSRFSMEACRHLSNAFGLGKCTPADLFPFVVDDDGILIIIDGNNQHLQIVSAKPIMIFALLLMLHHRLYVLAIVLVKEYLQKQIDLSIYLPQAYKRFSVECLHKYKWESSSALSLKNWVELRVRQHPMVRDCLGLGLSDFSLLKRVSDRKLQYLPPDESCLAREFRTIYRQHSIQNPELVKSFESTAQLLLNNLGNNSQRFQSLEGLIARLKNIANNLREQNSSISIYEVPEPILFPEEGENLLDEMESEIESLKLLLKQRQLQAIQSNLNKMRNSTTYSRYLDKVIPGLRLYYCDGLSYPAIAGKLGLSSTDQAHRIIGATPILNLVRSQSSTPLNLFFTRIVREFNLSYHPEEIEALPERAIFCPAAQDMRYPGSPRPMQSFYSRCMCETIESILSNTLEQNHE